MGFEQAKKAGVQLKDVNFHLAYSSDLARGAETLDTILNAMGSGCKAQYHPLVRERGMGKWVGHKITELTQFSSDHGCKHPDEWLGPFKRGSETVDDVRGRGIRFFKEVLESVENLNEEQQLKGNVANVLVVVHSMWMRFFLSYLNTLPGEVYEKFKGLSLGELTHFPLTNCGITCFQMEVEGKGEEEVSNGRFLTVNMDEHITGIPRRYENAKLSLHRWGKTNTFFEGFHVLFFWGFSKVKTQFY